MLLTRLHFTEYISLDAIIGLWLFISNHSLLIASVKELVLRTQSWSWVYYIFKHNGKHFNVVVHVWTTNNYCMEWQCFLLYCLKDIVSSVQFSPVQFSSVQFIRSVVSDSLRPRESQHARHPCPSPTPRVYLNSCPSSQWCHPAISASVIPFSFCLHSLPASGSFPMSQLFACGGQSIGVSALASVLPMNTQDWSPLEWTGWFSLQSKGLSRVFSNTTVQKHQFFGAQLSS